jgi:exodeoxyribonuclease V alpha subunit
VSGFPGTGKTLLVSAFVHLFEKMNFHYTLMSPTGIAAKRLSQVTCKPASTIHRSLGYKVDGTWEFNKNNKFHVDAVIVDEMSMVDMATFYNLITALPKDTVVIMVGDSAQLPSVGAGFVLQNLMNCETVCHTALTRIYRQEEASDIVKIAHSMLKNESIDTSFSKDSEFVFLNYDRDEVIGQICDLSAVLKEKGRNFQVIAPVYDGTLGVNNLNKELRDVLNPDASDKKSAFIKQGEVDICEGDRVMVIKNNYELAVFNGDVGKVTKISLKNNEVEVKIFNWFDSTTGRYTDKFLTLKVDEARSLLKVAYACTAHKCQGQEYDYILMPMTMQYGIMLYKNLVYTAITRAKKKVFIFGDPKAFLQAARNERESSRNSNFGRLIDDFVSLKYSHCS